MVGTVRLVGIELRVTLNIRTGIQVRARIRPKDPPPVRARRDRRVRGRVRSRAIAAPVGAGDARRPTRRARGFRHGKIRRTRGLRRRISAVAPRAHAAPRNRRPTRAEGARRPFRQDAFFASRRGRIGAHALAKPTRKRSRIVLVNDEEVVVGARPRERRKRAYEYKENPQPPPKHRIEIRAIKAASSPPTSRTSRVRSRSTGDG